MNNLNLNTPARIIGILIFIILNLSRLLAQNSYHPEKYNGIPEQEKKPLMIEGFENDTNKWGRTFMHTYCFRIDTGYFYLNSLNTNLVIAKETDLNSNQDIQIETEFIWVYDSPNKYFGVHWGSEPIRGHEADFYGENHFLYFGINSENQFIIEEAEKFKTNRLKSDTLKLTTKNKLIKLTIRKVGNTLYFFINEELIYQFEPNYFYGRYVGFQSKGFVVVKADNFKIWNLDKNK